MKTTTLLFSFVLMSSITQSQNLAQRGGRGGNYISNINNPYNNQSNVAVFNNGPSQNMANTNKIEVQQIQSNEDWNQVLDNVSRNIANDNVVQAVVIQQQAVLPSRGSRGNQREIMVNNIAQSRGNRGGSSNRGSRGSVAVIKTEQNQKKQQSRSSKLASIELPSPKPLNLDLAIVKDDRKIDIDLSKLSKDKADKKKTKQGGIYIEKKYFKKRVWKPVKIWFKRTFKKQKKIKVKLDCFF